MTDKPTEVTVELHEEGKRVTAHFRWEHAKWATATHAFINDGSLSVHMQRRDAEELYRKLFDALFMQDFADAGHRDEEKLMAEAEAQHDLAANR